MIPVQKTADKVAILGTTSTWQQAPFKDPNWEIWGMNAFWKTWGEYATRWFEIHPISIMKREGWDSYKWLTKCPIPVYMRKHYVNIPNSIPYPLADVSKGFIRQFSSTFCYQLALAIHEGFKTIGIYGVDFSGGTLRERFIEWRGVLYWLGVATGRGIEIILPDDKLSHRYLYGLDYWNEIDDVRRQIFGAYYYCSVFDGVSPRWKRKRK